MRANGETSALSNGTAPGGARLRVLALRCAPLAALLTFAAVALFSANGGAPARAAHELDAGTGGPAVTSATLASSGRPTVAAMASTTAGARAIAHIRHAYLRTRTTRSGSAGDGSPVRDRLRPGPALDDSWRHALVRARLNIFDMVSKGGLGADRSILHSTNNSP